MSEPAAKRVKRADGTEPAPPDSLAASASTSHRISAAVSQDKGSRAYMEDVWVIQQDCGQDSSFDCRLDFFAVFDGHGGVAAARFAADNLQAAVTKAGATQQELFNESKLNVKALKQAITKGFQDVDARILSQTPGPASQDGAAAVAVWVLGQQVAVANVGDAKCVLARLVEKEGGAPQLKAVTLTKEHLAIYPAERARIEKAGGYVSKDGRLNGRLQVSRSFGDPQFKRAGASATPDITAFKLTPRDRFMICACDGFWGVFDAQGAVDTMAQLLADGRDAKAATNRILHEAVRERKCQDNCTVMLLQFDQDGAPDVAASSELGQQGASGAPAAGLATPPEPPGQQGAAAAPCTEVLAAAEQDEQDQQQQQQQNSDTDDPTGAQRADGTRR